MTSHSSTASDGTQDCPEGAESQVSHCTAAPGETTKETPSKLAKLEIG